MYQKLDELKINLLDNGKTHAQIGLPNRNEKGHARRRNGRRGDEAVGLGVTMAKN
jgi:hypothetical protein